MSDERMEQEQQSTEMPEMSGTPFGQGAPETQEKPEPDPMEAAMAAMGNPGVDYGGTFKALRQGDLVDGVVVHIDREGVLVDVGTKSEGIIRPGELTKDPYSSPEEIVSVGEKIRVMVMDTDSKEGGPILSKKRADFEKAWEKVEKSFETGETIKAMVTDRIKGGLVVDLGIRGFVPASHVGSGKLKNLDKFIGQSMQFKVIEVDRERRKVVLSNRQAADEERDALRKETLATLTEGQIRDGVVRRLTDYGAFIDLGGVDGLLHISEMSWTRINKPDEVVKVGQKLQVMVLKMNLEQGRVSLGLRQILPDPWEDIKRKYAVGDVIKGQVTRLVPFGAFVQVESGIEGIIPNSELARRRVKGPEDVVSAGQEVEVKVIDLRPDERRLTLSLRALEQQVERERDETEYKSYQHARPEAKTTIGDLIGAQLGDYASSMAEANEEAEEAAPEAEAVVEAPAVEAEAAVEVAAEEPQAEAEPVVEAAPEETVEAVAEEPAVEEEVVVEEPAVAEEVVAEEAVVEEAVAEETAEEAVEEAPAVEETPAEEPEAEKTDES